MSRLEGAGPTLANTDNRDIFRGRKFCQTPCELAKRNIHGTLDKSDGSKFRWLTDIENQLASVRRGKIVRGQHCDIVCLLKDPGRSALKCHLPILSDHFCNRGEEILHKSEVFLARSF